MERVIVTVKRQGEAQVRDLELPADVESRRLAELIAEALRWETDAAGQPIEYEIEAQPLGRKLHQNESLESAGVWDGSWLVLQHPSATPPATQPPLQAPLPSPPPNAQRGLEGSPVTGWTPLGIDLPGVAPRETTSPKQPTPSERPSAPEQPSPEERPAPETQKRESGFVWKQID